MSSAAAGGSRSAGAPSGHVRDVRRNGRDSALDRRRARTDPTPDGSVLSRLLGWRRRSRPAEARNDARMKLRATIRYRRRTSHMISTRCPNCLPLSDSAATTSVRLSGIAIVADGSRGGGQNHAWLPARDVCGSSPCSAVARRIEAGANVFHTATKSARILGYSDETVTTLSA